MWLRRAGWQTETYWTFKESVEDPSRSMGIQIFDPSLGSGSLAVRATQASVIIRYTLGDCGWAKDIRVAVIPVQPVSAAGSALEVETGVRAQTAAVWVRLSVRARVSTCGTGCVGLLAMIWIHPEMAVGSHR